MSWNHRVLVFPDGDDLFFDIYDVYYDKDGNPNGFGHGESCHGNSKDELLEVLARMRVAIRDKPWLWGGDRFPEEYRP